MGDFWAVPFARMGMQGCIPRERHEFEHPVARGQPAALRRMPQAIRAEGQGQTVGTLDTLDSPRRRYL